MNDAQYLDKFVAGARLFYSSDTLDLVSIKDLDQRYLTVTFKMLEFMGNLDAKVVLGKTLDEIKSFISSYPEIVDKFKEQNNEIMKTKQNKVFMEIGPIFGGHTGIYTVYKDPIINPDTGNCVGLRTQLSKMYRPNVPKFLFKVHGAKGLLINSSNIEDPFEHYPLNEAQHMVLYLCLHNYSYSEIALFMNEFGHEVTPIRVNDYLEQLKLIFHVRTKSQLIEKAIGNGFHVLLPQGFFNKFCSIEMTNEAAVIVEAAEKEHSL